MSLIVPAWMSDPKPPFRFGHRKARLAPPNWAPNTRSELTQDRRRKSRLDTGPAVRPARRTAGPVSRRDFLRRSWVSSLLVFGAQFGGASLAFLWPNLKGGFGSLIQAGTINDIKQQIQQTNQPFYYG